MCDAARLHEGARAASNPPLRQETSAPKAKKCYFRVVRVYSAKSSRGVLISSGIFGNGCEVSDMIIG